MPSASHASRCSQANLRSVAIALAAAIVWFATTPELLFAEILENPFTRSNQLAPTQRAKPLQTSKALVSDSRRPQLHAPNAIHWRASLVNHLSEEQTAEQNNLPAPVAEPKALASPLANPFPASKQEVVATPTDCFVAAPMSTVSINVSLPAGTLPEDVAAKCAATNPPNGDTRLQSGWALAEQHWSATCQRHRPLYFEEINAERYGYTPAYCMQPIISAGHFFLTIPALPYKMAVDCPRDCTYTLGHYRPGSCVPWRINHLPCRTKATAAELATIAGLILLIP